MYTLKQVTKDDALELLKWKNDVRTKKYSLVTESVILWANHIAWLNRRLQKPGFFIIMKEQEKCGDLRFDIEEEIEVSIRLDQKHQGKGIGTAILGIACGLIEAQYQKTLLAKIVDGNTASFSIFTKAGFIPVEHKTDNGKSYTILKRG